MEGPSKVFRRSLLKQLANQAAIIFISAQVVGGLGCSSPRPSAQAQISAPLQSGELNPVQAWNKYLGVLAEGDKEALRASIYLHPGTNEQARLDGSIAVLGSSADLRRAFDQAYGSGRLAALGFHCFSPGAQLPQQTTFRIEGDHATASTGRDSIGLVRDGDTWKEDFLPWPELMRLRSESKDTQTLPLDRLLLNMQAVSQLLDRTASEVRKGVYISASDAFGVLNERLHGQAWALAPLSIAYSIDLTCNNPVTAAVPIIELRGDPAALGQSQASQLGETIRPLMHDYFGRVFDLSNAKGRKTYHRALKVAARFESYMRPEHREEIRALAASVGVDPAEAILGQCFADLNPGGSCSTISLAAAASPDGITRFGRNLDYDTFGILNQHTVLLVYHPRDRYAFVSVAVAPGLVGVLSGMNEHGLSLAVMEVPRAFRLPHAMPCMLLYRTVLENCKTVDEAVALLRKTPRQTANNLMLMDASGDRVVAEITPSQVTIRRAPKTAALISTNHQRGGDLDSPGRCIRFDFLHDAARRQFGQLSESKLEELLAGAAQGDATFQSMVFEPANRILYLAVGADAPSHGFARIDLNPLF
jgi:hypothetical protein